MWWLWKCSMWTRHYETPQLRYRWNHVFPVSVFFVVFRVYSSPTTSLCLPAADSTSDVIYNTISATIILIWCLSFFFHLPSWAYFHPVGARATWHKFKPNSNGARFAARAISCSHASQQVRSTQKLTFLKYLDTLTQWRHVVIWHLHHLYHSTARGVHDSLVNLLQSACRGGNACNFSCEAAMEDKRSYFESFTFTATIFFW